MDLPIRIERRSTEPAYQQIQAGILGLLRQGTLRPGDRLPTTRRLAGQLRVNRSTVVAAYRALVASGAADATVGRGTFVAPRAADPAARPATATPPAGTRQPASIPWQPVLSRAIDGAARHDAGALPLAADHPAPVDFAALAPDESLFPVDAFRELIARLLAERGRELLQYGSTRGDADLRAAIAGDLRRAGIDADPEAVVIVNGIQQGIDLTLRTLIDPGDAVVVESPTWVSVLPSLGLYRAEVIEVPMTPRGLDVEQLERVVTRRRPKLIYTMPNFQNPTGITMDLATRRRLLDLAGRHGIPILEDDYEKDLRLHGDELPCLQALDQAGLVIHMGTFSKGLFPGLRLGWIAAPPALVEPLHLAKRVSDLHTGSLIQAAVAEFCTGGHYERHLATLRRVYRDRQRALLAAMQRHLPAQVSWTRPEGGFVVWVTLPERLDAEALLREAAAAGVAATPGRIFFHGDQGAHHLRLSIAQADPPAIERGVRVLGERIRWHLEHEDATTTRRRRPADTLPQL